MAETEVMVRGWTSPRGVERMRSLFKALFMLLTRVEAHGLENLPPGGLIVSPNHLSSVDPPLVFIMLPGRKQTVFVADKYRHHWFFRPIVTMVDCIWVNRGATAPSTIKAAVRALQSGSVLGVAPEGTRSPNHALQKGKTGAVYLAYASGVPIVPAAMTGPENAFPSLFRLRRARLTITFGEPIRFGEPGQRTRPTTQQLEAGTTEVMCRIAAMLPPEYRGVYADHPRLKELLEAKRTPVSSAVQPG
jgi:1-acyl-sn-glycerol-3-phosphate acyltransferase